MQPPEPHRYKVLYGGRGGIKSWSIAQSLLIAGTKQDLRIQLLEDQIQRLGMQGEYEIQKAEIATAHDLLGMFYRGADPGFWPWFPHWNCRRTPVA